MIMYFINLQGIFFSTEINTPSVFANVSHNWAQTDFLLVIYYPAKLEHAEWPQLT